MRNSIFKVVLSSIQAMPSQDNPFLVTAKFIFADNQGNENGMGIEFVDFPEVASSAINMPVKMKYLGEGVGNHAGSIPIGHITEMNIQDDGEIKQLIGTAALYAEEYPDEISFLMESFKSGDAPGISWELGYADSVIKDGIQWLKGIITKAATFVRQPAYGKRTALLALASDAALTDKEFDVELLKLAGATSIDTKGGNTVNEEELKKEVARLKEELAAKDAALAAKNAELETLQTTNSSVVEENKTLKEKVASIEKNILAEERARKYVEAGFTFSEEAEKAAEKKAFLASLEPNVFESYLADLVTAKASAKPAASASASSGTQIPKPNLTDQDKDMTIDDLRAQVRAAARSS
jgi:hypothetical protein